MEEETRTECIYDGRQVCLQRRVRERNTKTKESVSKRVSTCIHNKNKTTENSVKEKEKPATTRNSSDKNEECCHESDLWR